MCRDYIEDCWKVQVIVSSHNSRLVFLYNSNVVLSNTEKRFLLAAIIINGLCLGMFFMRLFITGTSRYWFIPQNALLAWLAFMFSWLLARYLKDHNWRSWQAISLTLLWLVFLPNTWYVMTDYIHLVDNGEISRLYDIALINSLIASAFLAGFASLVLVHKQLLRRLKTIAAGFIVAAVILLASFAIYLGRDLRWNTWDVVVNPGGIVLGTSDRLIDTVGHPRMLNVTGLFFVVIGLGYLAIWQLVKPQN